MEIEIVVNSGNSGKPKVWVKMNKEDLLDLVGELATIVTGKAAMIHVGDANAGWLSFWVSTVEK